MEQNQIDLYEFLVESELQHYYNAIKNELKITNASQFKYATDEDLKQIGLSRPEIRRLRKFHEKYFPHGYISKIKRFLQTPTVKKEESPITAHTPTTIEPNKTYSPKQVPNNKHIIPADAICVNKQLGTGEFGIVQQGVWTNGSDRIQVAIKCLCRERMQSNPMEFLKEASIMHSIEHENIVRLYGVVLATDSLMLVTELAHLRSLLECLKDSGLRVSFLTVPTLCEFAMQICNGMMYLENKRLIHRDLAARNILVFSKNKVKISDFGLSRALGVGKDYYKTNFNVNLKLPIAWCAPECINYLRFTNSSDVWAFGVSLWEMFSYGFQPWAALTGLQILEAIDEPNYQRLEQPECCPREYYNLMLKCWQHDPAKRPKFSEIYQMLPDIKPEQLKTVVNHYEPKKDHLVYRQGEIITVLERNTNSPFWKGVLNSGKTGYFNPTNTVAHLEGLPSSNRFPSDSDSLCRTGSERCSKRKLRTEMISKPQDDLKHTGHVGIDGDSFGDIAFLANSQNYNHLPRQVVTPYKPSEDIEQTPLLLPPTPTSPDSLQTASGYFSEENPTSSTNPTFQNSIDENNTRKQNHSAFGSFDFSSKKSMLNSLNPFASENVSSRNSSSSFAMQNNNYGLEASAFTNANLEDDSFNEPQNNHHHNHPDQKYGLSNWSANKHSSISDQETQHEYHEISDDEITTENVFDLGPSLLDEINSMFGSINGAAEDNASNFFEFEHTNKKNEIAEITSKHNRKNSTSDTNGNKSKKKHPTGVVKQISVKDEKILNHAIEIANEFSARSMTDLVSENAPVTHSPKRKFSFRFPNLSHHHTNDKDHTTANGTTSGTLSYSKEKKNFTEELKSIPDLQRFRSLSEIEMFNSDIRIPLFDKKSADFCFEKSREILTRPINIELQTARQNQLAQIDTQEKFIPMTTDLVDENLIDIENTLKALNFDFLQTYNNLDKTDSAETLFSEQVSQIVSSLEASARNEEHFYDNNIFEKQLHYTSSKMDKFDEKRSITPDTGFASRETNLSLSRRSIQKGGSFSPQDSFFSPRDSSLHSSSVESRGYMHLKNEPGSAKSTKSNFSCSPVKTFNNSNNSIYYMQNSPIAIDNSSSRQRSMSFTDNYNLRSPILCEPQQREYQSGGSFRNKSRNVIPYKPRSIRARTLRRLSYNPIVIDSSSSSNDDSDFDHSIAHSECDIRTRMSSTSRQRRQYLNRKTGSMRNSGGVVGDGRSGSGNKTKDSIYGSNSSIKSAPHYNYANEKKERAMSSGRYHGTGGQYFNYDNEYDEKLNDFVNTHALARNNYKSGNVIKPPKAFAMNGSGMGTTSNYTREALYHEFDIYKLTGKSPTTNTVFQQNEAAKSRYAAMIKNSDKSKSISNANNLPSNVTPQAFQWPEKIHASAIKQNDLMWRQQQQQQSTAAAAASAASAAITVASSAAQMSHFNNVKVKPAFSSDSSSSDTEEFEFRQDFVPRIPPSPAP